MTVIDLPRRERVASTSFKVEILSGADLAAADWPSIGDDRDLRMHVFQSREFLDVWLGTIGKASRIEPYFVVVSDGNGKAVYLATIHARIRYGAFSVKRMDVEVSTNDQGKARIEGLPSKAKPIVYDIEKDGTKATAQQDVATGCLASLPVTLK